MKARRVIDQIREQKAKEEAARSSRKVALTVYVHSENAEAVRRLASEENLPVSNVADGIFSEFFLTERVRGEEQN